ncbi:MAG: hypothetical protein ACKODC_04140, partial [Limnohabitans sp.]
EQGLEKQHGRSPDRRAAAEPGEDLLAYKGLDLKKQKSADENSERKRQEFKGGRYTDSQDLTHC